MLRVVPLLVTVSANFTPVSCLKLHLLHREGRNILASNFPILQTVCLLCLCSALSLSTEGKNNAELNYIPNRRITITTAVTLQILRLTLTPVKNISLALCDTVTRVAETQYHTQGGIYLS